jgi:flavin-dependent dehydrogenase
MTDCPQAVDAIVVGGGPAGATTALLLVRAGISTLLLESSDGSAQPIGETLPPVANRLLRDLDLWDAFGKQGHRASEGIISAWSDDHPQANDFFVSAQGPGWNLDRTRFDVMLLQECESAGAVISRRSRLLACHRTPDRRWLLEFRKNGRRYRTHSRHLVDATGKLGAVPLRGLARRVAMDRLIGVASFLPCADASRYTIVEAVDDGWFYSARLPRERIAVMYFTDADIYSARRKTDSHYWNTQLNKARHTRDRIRNAAVPPNLIIVPATTTRREQSAGEGWIAVGDAAQSFDPLSSLGIFKALDSARCASETVTTVLSGTDPGGSYANWSREVFGHYLRRRAEYYKSQRRWAGSTFWERRRTA